MRSIVNVKLLNGNTRLSVLIILIFLSSLMIFGCSLNPPHKAKVSENKSSESIKNATYSKSTFGLYDISTFDVYVDGQIIHVIAGGKQFSGDQHIVIRYTRSEDGGYRWKNSVAIDDAFPTTIANRGNDIQLAVNGKYMVAVWQTEGELPGMGPMVSAYSSDNGKTWRRGLNPAANNDGSQAHIDLIADQHGNFHVVWLEDPDENGYQGLRYSRSMDHGQQWRQPVTLDQSTCSCCWNTFALSPDNKLNILYRDMTPRDMSLIQSSDAGLTWQRTSAVGDFQWQFNGCPHVGGGLKTVEINGAVQLHSIVWTGVQESPGLYHLYSDEDGQRWSAPKKLGNVAINGDVAVRGRHNVAAIWNEMEADGMSIFYAKSENGDSTWLTPHRLTQAKNAATHPRLVATKHGFLAMWTEKPNVQSSQLAWQIFK